MAKDARIRFEREILEKIDDLNYRYSEDLHRLKIEELRIEKIMKSIRDREIEIYKTKARLDR